MIPSMAMQEMRVAMRKWATFQAPGHWCLLLRYATLVTSHSPAVLSQSTQSTRGFLVRHQALQAKAAQLMTRLIDVNAPQVQRYGG